jgi:hypothetical protein
VGRAAGGRRASPFRNFSKHSLRYLLETGFGYDSSLMGDDIPYACATATPRCSNFPSTGRSTTSRTTRTKLYRTDGSHGAKYC